MKVGMRMLVGLAIVLWFCAAPALAETDAETAQRLKALEEKVGQLTRVVEAQSVELSATRKSNNELKAKLNQKALAGVKADAVKDADRRSAMRHNLWANLDIQLYGKVKADVAVDTSRTSTGNFARWVEHETTNGGDCTLNTTAKETRLGLKITGPESNGIKTSGVIEIDFWGGGTENKPTPMMRHAFMQIDWVESGCSLLAGQTWDVISPLNPSTLNYPVQWWAGNIGYRRPQVRLTKVCDLGNDMSLKLETAVARNIGHDSAFDPGDSGEDSAFPSLQGRVSVTGPCVDGRKATFGVSGHYAREEYDVDAKGENYDADSWSINFDAAVPILEWLAMKMEMHHGQNLDAYLGGIGQGVVVGADRLDEIQATGGWIAASLGPWGPWSFNVGYSGEWIGDAQVASDARTCNTALFGNVLYKINDNASVGFELSKWRTEYKAEKTGHSVRAQTSFIYKF